MTLDDHEIGSRIKQARDRAGLRQEDLADLINVSTRTVQNLEAGDVTPYRHLSRIAQATNVTQEWLLHGDQEPGEDADALAGLENRLVRDLRRLEQEQAEQRRILDELLRLAQDDPPAPPAAQQEQ